MPVPDAIVPPRGGVSGVSPTAAVPMLALATFLGAFLLFFVQPLIARFVLPWFGGSAGVWTTCLLFFQVCLLAGYAYADALAQWLPPRAQIVVHVAVLAAAVLMLPIVPGPEWKPSPEAAPVPHLLRLLTVSIGLPFLVLATTGPLLQAWFSRLRPGQSPYRLYALSNAGSLLALLSYPLLFEPWLVRTTQAAAWAWAFGLYGLLVVAVGLAVWRIGGSTSRAGQAPLPAPESPPTTGAAPPDVAAQDAGDEGPHTSLGLREGSVFGTRLLWLALPACASLLLMAMTNKLCEDLASAPFVWVVPLSLYLLTFILCFDSPAWYLRRACQIAFWIWLPAMAYGVVRYDIIPWPAQVVLYGAGLFVMCLICHGELYRLRPAPQELTRFYLLIATGGALGGGFVAIGAPVAFDGYFEVYAGVLLLAVLLVVIHVREKATIRRWRRPLPLWPFTLGGSVVVAVLVATLAWADQYRSVERHRDFYGVFRILELRQDNPFNHARVFMSGGTIHGAQYRHPVKATWPTTYYDRGSGIGLLLEQLPAPRRIGLVGLGIGTLAAYGQAGDVMRFYELSPYVVEVARTRFSYLAQSAAQIEVAVGDARLSLEREVPQGFDILVLDAFTSDAIPVHLLTREAFDIYRRHLKPGGVLAIHSSNRHLELGTVIQRLAAYWGVSVAEVRHRPGADRPEAMSSDWMLLTDNPTLLALTNLRFSQPSSQPSPVELADDRAFWTDDHVSLLPRLKYGRSPAVSGSGQPAR